MSRLAWIVAGLIILVVIAGSAASWVISRDTEMGFKNPERREEVRLFCSYSMQTNATRAIGMAREQRLKEADGLLLLSTLFWESVVAAAPSQVHDDALVVLDAVRLAADGSDPSESQMSAAERLDRWIARECPAYAVDPGVDPPN